MPSTYTTNNGIEKIGTGEQSGTWGDTTNLNFDILDQALDGLVTITATDTGSSGSPNTLPITDGTLSDGRNRLIIITDGGDLGGSVYYQLTPADAEKIVFLRNSLSGSRDLILFQGTYNAARDLIVPAGKDVIIKFSGGGTSNAVVAPVFADLSLDAATIASADINGGTIDGVTIGVTSVATVINVDNLKLDGNTLSSTNTNGNVVLAPNGNGDVQLDTDTVRVGDNNNDVTITTNGTGDLTLNTNSGTNSGSIEIQDGVNTNIIVTANGTGKLELANGDITTSASSGSDAAGQDLTIQAGASTGNAAGGDMIFQTTPAGAGSGTNLNSYTTVLTLTDDSKLKIGTSTAVNSILDEDNMASNSATALSTQQSIKAYVDSQVGTVDTLAEILANGNTTGGNNIVFSAGDNITNASGDLTLDVAGNIILDADGGFIAVKDAGIEIGNLGNYSSDFAITASVQDKDIIFKGNDNGSIVDALTLDMSEAGRAIFNADANMADGNAFRFGDNQDFLIYHSSNQNIIQANTTDQDIIFKGVDNGSSITALTLDMSDAGKATFNSHVALGDSKQLQLGADADMIIYHDGSTNYVQAAKQDSDLILRGNDGGAGVNALTLDMSEAGRATFNDVVRIPTNLEHAGDADTFFGFPGANNFIITAGNVSRVYGSASETVINEDSADLDFRVESDSNTHMLFVDAGNDRVAVGTNDTTSVNFTVANSMRVQSYSGNDAFINLAVGATAASPDQLYTIRIDNDQSDSFEIDDNTDGSEFFRYTPSVGIILNEESKADNDFRVESDGNTHMLFVDAGGNNVNIASSTDTSYTFNVKNGVQIDVLNDLQDNQGYPIIFATDGGTGGIRTGEANHLVIQSRTTAPRDVIIATRDNSGVARERLTAYGNDEQLVINEDSRDYNFRVESNSNANMLFVDAGNDAICINTNSITTSPLNIQSDSNARAIRIVGRSDDYGEVDFFENDNSTQLVRLQAHNTVFNIRAYDIPMVFQMTTVDCLRINTSGIVVNEGSANRDFRVESDSNSNGIVVDAGLNAVGIMNAAVQNYALTVGGTGNFIKADNGINLRLETTDADAGEGPLQVMYRDSASPADGDILGQIYYQGKNDAAQTVTYALVSSEIADASDGTEDGKYKINTVISGNSRSRLNFEPGATTFNDDSQDINVYFESNNNNALLFLDGGNDHVNIGSSTDRGGLLNVDGTTKGIVVRTTNSAAMELIYADNGAGTGPIMYLNRPSSSPAADDQLGRIIVQGKNSADEVIDYVRFVNQLLSPTDGSEQGRFAINTMTSGTMNSRLNILNGESVFNDESVNVDFRVESNGNANAFLIDGGSDTASFSIPLQMNTSYIQFTGNLSKPNIGAAIYRPAADSVAVVTNNQDRMVISNTEVNFNEDSQNTDFRVESDGNANMLFVDAGNNVVNINATGTDKRFRVDSGNITTAYFSYVDASDVSLMQIKHARAGYNSNTATMIQFQNSSGTEVGTIKSGASGTTFNTSSDYRLKENVVYDWDATTRLKQLKPARFNFIVDADTTVDGFLAHEAQTVVPEAVSGTHNQVDDNGDAVMQGIDQSKLVPLLVKTIQELEARITALENA
jgi:hypothetical protein